MDHFELVSTIQTNRRSAAGDRGTGGRISGKAISLKPCLVSLVPVRHLLWRMSFSN